MAGVARRVGLRLGELGDVPSSTVWAVRYCFDWGWLVVVLHRDLEKLAIVTYPYMDFWLACELGTRSWRKKVGVEVTMCLQMDGGVIPPAVLSDVTSQSKVESLREHHKASDDGNPQCPCSLFTIYFH